MRTHPNPWRDASLYFTNPPLPKGKVRINADVGLIFNSWKLHSHSSVHLKGTLLQVKLVKHVAIEENPAANLL